MELGFTYAMQATRYSILNRYENWNVYPIVLIFISGSVQEVPAGEVREGHQTSLSERGVSAAPNCVND